MYKILWLLVVSRMLDLVSTYLVTDDLSTELSPLVTLLNMGWLGLIITNVILITIITISVVFMKRKEYLIVEIEERYRTKIKSFKDYLCFILFKEELNSNNKYWINKQIAFPSIYFFFFSLLYTFIIGSLLVSISNFLIFFDIYSLHIFSPSLLSFILFVINIILSIYFFFFLIKKRYSVFL